MRMIACAMLSATLLLSSVSERTKAAWLQESGIDPEALIDQILSVESREREEVRDLILDAEYLEGKYDDDKGFEQQKRFIKQIYIRYLPDTVLFHEEFLEYYEDGERKSDKDLHKQVREYREKREKRKTRTIAFRMLQPFDPGHREQYDIEYRGIADEPIEGYVCHHFQVTAGERDRDLLDGDYYFEAESFHLVRVDFSPAKLSGNVMFSMKEMEMSLQYGPTPDGYWIPREFQLRGKGKAALFFGVNFAVEEYYSNPRINTGIQADLFEEKDGYR